MDRTTIVSFKKGKVYRISSRSSDQNGLIVSFERFVNEDQALCKVLNAHGRYSKEQMVICNRLEMRNEEG